MIEEGSRVKTGTVANRRKVTSDAENQTTEASRQRGPRDRAERRRFGRGQKEEGEKNLVLPALAIVEKGGLSLGSEYYSYRPRWGRETF